MLIRLIDQCAAMIYIAFALPIVLRILFGGWYLLSARTWFTGPVPDASIDDELRWSVDRHRQADREEGGSPQAWPAGHQPAVEPIGDLFTPVGGTVRPGLSHARHRAPVVPAEGRSGS